MHNWLEGVLQHHLRVLWGIGRKSLTKEEPQEKFSDSDVSESSSELEELEHEHRQPQRQTQPNPDQMDVDDNAEDNEPTTPTLRNFLNLDFGDDDDDDEADEEYFPVFELPSRDVEAIRACIQDVVLPSWVGRPPKNLGEAKHGKLKAKEYLTLFSAILPLVLAELWWQGDAVERSLLQNFYNLITCTNILASFSTSNDCGDRYTNFYHAYRRDLPTLFPGFHSMPNHHLAMHNGALLKYWGPLAGLSEFPGERLNGILQKVKTNRRVCTLTIP
jgi:hypothetical protein